MSQNTTIRPSISTVRPQMATSVKLNTSIRPLASTMMPGQANSFRPSTTQGNQLPLASPQTSFRPAMTTVRPLVQTSARLPMPQSSIKSPMSQSSMRPPVSTRSGSITRRGPTMTLNSIKSIPTTVDRPMETESFMQPTEHPDMYTEKSTKSTTNTETRSKFTRNQFTTPSSSLPTSATPTPTTTKAVAKSTSTAIKNTAGSASCPSVIDLARSLNMHLVQPSYWSKLNIDCCGSMDNFLKTSVICSSGQVVDIHWGDLNLNGTFGDALLPNNLAYLDVSYNQITGGLPKNYPIFGLELSENYMYGNVSAIPSTLQEIGLSNNLFYGEIVVKKPKVFDISSNFISDVFLMDSSRLEACYLDNNPLLNNTHVEGLVMCSQQDLYEFDPAIVAQKISEKKLLINGPLPTEITQLGSGSFLLAGYLAARCLSIFW